MPCVLVGQLGQVEDCLGHFWSVDTNTSESDLDPTQFNLLELCLAKLLNLAKRRHTLLFA